MATKDTIVHNLCAPDNIETDGDIQGEFMEKLTEHSEELTLFERLQRILIYHDRKLGIENMPKWLKEDFRKIEKAIKKLEEPSSSVKP